MSLGVQRIKQADERTLAIQWTDGIEQKLDVVAIRRACPCAACIDEVSRKPLLKPEAVAETVRPTRILSVGRYAISFEFNDGHRSGIYTYETLRSLSS